VSSAPRLLSILMCLTIFTWMPWNARQPDELFPKAQKVYKQCSPGICPCWSSSPMTLVSSLIIISEQIQRAATCVPPVAEPPGLKRFGFGHGQSCDPGPGDLALFFPSLPTTSINLQRAGSMIPMSKCSCLCLLLSMLLHAGFSNRWLFRRTLVADGNFTQQII